MSRWDLEKKAFSYLMQLNGWTGDEQEYRRDLAKLDLKGHIQRDPSGSSI